MDDVKPERETFLLEFAYYGPYQEDMNRNNLTQSSSSGYPDSSTLPLSSSISSLNTSISDQQSQIKGTSLIDQNSEIKNTTEIATGTIAKTSSNSNESRDLHSKNIHEHRLKIRRKKPQHKTLLPDNISSEEQISIQESQECVSESTSGNPSGDSPAVPVQITNSTNGKMPKFSSYNTCNPSSSEIPYSFKGSLQENRIFPTSSKGAHPSGDSTFADTCSSQTSTPPVRNSGVKGTVSYCESSTDSSVIIEAENINIENLLCTEKNHYLGSFKLDAQEESENSYSKDESDKKPSFNIEYFLGDVSAREEDKSVLLKLRRRNQARMDERDQIKMMGKKHPKTLPNIIAWPDSKAEDFRTARAVPEKGLIFDKVPEFQEIIDILKYDKNAINMFVDLNKYKTNMELKADGQRDTIPNKAVEMNLFKGCKVNVNNDSDNTVANVREIYDTAESRRFCSVRLKQLKWLETNHFPHTKLYEHLKVLRKERVFPKKVKAALPHLEPAVNEDITATRSADLLKTYANVTKSISTLKKLRHGKKIKGNINEQDDKTDKQGNADQLGVPCIVVTSPSGDIRPVLYVQGYQPSRNKSALIQNFESPTLTSHPLKTTVDKRAILKELEEESSNSSLEMKNAFEEESTFDVGKLNFSYSIEQLQRKRKVKRQRAVNSWKTYCRIKRIIAAFTHGQKEERYKVKSQSKRNKSKNEDRLGRSRQMSTVTGHLRWFPFLSKADATRMTPDLLPSFQKVYSKDFLQQIVLKAMESFVVRKEIVVSDYNGETCMSITFTKPSVFKKYKMFDASK
ncbi:hypothetical protein ACJMK2_035205 [Sinanodonta woodiana]|uniref:Uncharacterized protein n=1 Tax=Sinanodonta woodiana TaxID=1069815 RepID=A0ABD3WU51_SINWO